MGPGDSAIVPALYFSRAYVRSCAGRWKRDSHLRFADSEKIPFETLPTHANTFIPSPSC